jgi:hypothetical protein
VVGVAKYNTSKVVMNMTEKKEDQVRSNEIRPIPQLNGLCETQKKEAKEIFSFKSDFVDEDIENCIDEIFKNTNVSS